MTKEELAGTLNNRAIGEEISTEEAETAKQNGLVVIYGAADDLCELRGALYDELGAYRECLVLIGKDGTLLTEIDDDDIDVLKKHGVLGAVQKLHDAATQVKVYWHDKGNPCWTYETPAPHATFDVMEDGEVYCRGIVLDLKELECLR